MVLKTTFEQSQRWSYYSNFTVYFAAQRRKKQHIISLETNVVPIAIKDGAVLHRYVIPMKMYLNQSSSNEITRIQ